MTSWMTTGELAEVFDAEPALIRTRLRALGLLGERSEPSDMAERHDLGAIEGDYTSAQALWHPDVVILLKGTGLIDRPDPGPAALFDLPAEAPGTQARAIAAKRAASHADSAPAPQSRAASEPARAPRPDGPSPAGGASYVPGADRYGFDQVIATDGACSGNPGPGGWAWVDELTGEHGSGGERSTTNNIMELTAMLRALEYADDAQSLLIRSDSQYVINVVMKWAKGWRRKGWKKADGKPVKNRELIERLLATYEARTAPTRIDWVRGHNGDAGNEEADRLAVAERDRN